MIRDPLEKGDREAQGKAVKRLQALLAVRPRMVGCMQGRGCCRCKACKR